MCKKRTPAENLREVALVSREWGAIRDFGRGERVVEESAFGTSAEQQCLGWITVHKTLRAQERRAKCLGQGAYSFLPVDSSQLDVMKSINLHQHGL